MHENYINKICAILSEVPSFVGKPVRKNRSYTGLQWIFLIQFLQQQFMSN